MKRLLPLILLLLPVVAHAQTTQPVQPIVITSPVDATTRLIESISTLLGAVGTVLGVLAVIFHKTNATAISANTRAAAANQTKLAQVEGTIATVAGKAEIALNTTAQSVNHLGSQLSGHQAAITGTVAQIGEAWKAIGAISLATPAPGSPAVPAPASATIPPPITVK